MKGTLLLVNPEERIPINIDAWCRLMFERNATKLGLPSIPAREAATKFPETFMCICAYYATKRQGIFKDLAYEDFELRWDGIEVESQDEPEDLVNPTPPAR